MKLLKHLMITLVTLVVLSTVTSTADAAGYYYKWKGYSGNSAGYVTSKPFVNAVKKGKVTVNGCTVSSKVSEKSLTKSSQVMMKYALGNHNLKSKYLKRKYDSVILLNDNLKTIGIEMPVKKGKITKQQFKKIYGSNYAEAQIIENETSVYYKFKNHYFEGVFDKKNRLIRVSISSFVSGEFGKEIDDILFNG